MTKNYQKIMRQKGYSKSFIVAYSNGEEMEFQYTGKVENGNVRKPTE